MNEFIHYLKYDRSYKSGVLLYQKHGRDLSFKHVLNQSAENSSLHMVLLEELRKTFNMPTIDFNYYLSKRVIIEPIEKESSSDPTSEMNHNSDVQPVNLTRIPEFIKKSIRLREEFPFLKEKDCPNELKVLVSDMLTAYDKYREKHSELFLSAGEDQLKEIAKTVVDNYLRNRNIWDILVYYRENKCLPEIEENKKSAWEIREAEIRALSNADLVKLLNNVKPYISNSEKKIEKNPQSPKIQEWKEKLEFKRKEKALIEQLLNLK